MSFLSCSVLPGIEASVTGSKVWGLAVKAHIEVIRTGFWGFL